MKNILNQVTKSLCLLALAAFLSQNAYALSASANKVQGEVMVLKAGAAEGAWTAITQDTALANGDSLKTGKGTCTLAYSDQATFDLQENTNLTLQEKPEAQDINLLLGKIRGKVNHQNAKQPFEVVTPAAVATVRGTEVDFGFNDQGQFTADLHNGNIQIINEDAELKLDLDGKKSITVKYDKDANTIRIKNECTSDGPVKFNVLGTEYAESPCDEKEVSLSTAEKGNDVPGTDLNQGREPLSET